jgi:hypothetical protein
MSLRSTTAIALIGAAVVIAACSGPEESAAPSIVTGASGTGAASVEPSAPDEAPVSASSAPSVTTISPFDLEVGDCFDAPDDEAISEVELIDCEDPHIYETYHIESHPAGRDEPYIGDEAMEDYADDLCMAAFEGFVGVAWEESTLNYLVLQPTQETWEDVGDREVLCAVYDPEGELTGTAEGSGR